MIHYKKCAAIPEWSKGTDLRPVALASWVRIPLRARGLVVSLIKTPPSNWGEIVTGQTPSSQQYYLNICWFIVIYD